MVTVAPSLQRLWQRGCDFLGAPLAIMGGAMTWVLRRDDILGVAPDKFLARRKHAAADQIQAGAGDKPGNDAASARLAHRVGCDDDVGKFFCLHKGSGAAERLKPRWSRQIEVARTGGR